MKQSEKDKKAVKRVYRLMYFMCYGLTAIMFTGLLVICKELKKYDC